MPSTAAAIPALSKSGLPALNLESFMGRQIRDGRQRHGLSLSALARKTSIPPDELADYEAGTARIPAAALISIIEALGMTLSEMFDL
jgi:transcriptional regulator with XRE-family HTH domain